MHNATQSNEAMNHGLPPGAVDELLQLIYTNQKLQACKRYKEMSGASLGDAKRFIEELTNRQREESPHRFEKTSKSGCSPAMLLAIAIVALTASVCVWLMQTSKP